MVKIKRLPIHAIFLEVRKKLIPLLIHRSNHISYPSILKLYESNFCPYHPPESEHDH